MIDSSTESNEYTHHLNKLYKKISSRLPVCKFLNKFNEFLLFLSRYLNNKNKKIFQPKSRILTSFLFTRPFHHLILYKYFPRKTFSDYTNKTEKKNIKTFTVKENYDKWYIRWKIFYENRKFCCLTTKITKKLLTQLLIYTEFSYNEKFSSISVTTTVWIKSFSKL